MHHVELDQSGRTEKLNQPSALAFANGIQGSILIPAKEKRLIYATLKARRDQFTNRDLRVFAAAVFLLIKDHCHAITTLTIDREWTGHEATIKGLVLGYVRKIVPRFPTEGIAFDSIGRRSGAHALAYRVYKQKTPPDRVVTATDILPLL